MEFNINEIFNSIQGEGVYTGLPATFIRFSKCNLKCKWCDTDFENSHVMTIEEILSEISKYKTKSIIITGGEPLVTAYQDIYKFQKLLDELVYNGFEVHIETNGTFLLGDIIKYLKHITISPKLPSSGEYNQDLVVKCFNNYLSNPKCSFKFVISDIGDFNALVDCLYLLPQIPESKIYLSPANPHLSYLELLEMYRTNLEIEELLDNKDLKILITPQLHLIFNIK